MRKLLSSSGRGILAAGLLAGCAQKADEKKAEKARICVINSLHSMDSEEIRKSPDEYCSGLP